MRPPDDAAREMLAAFSSAGRRTRAHALGRWWSCPFEALEALVPARGRILDLGCGFGHFAMYLALSGVEREVLGVDIDGAKIEVGATAVSEAGLGERVELRRIEPSWRPGPAEFDAVVAVDVLYLMGAGAAEGVIGAMGMALRPGGRVVIKEMGTGPRWKYVVNEVQERLATRVFGITEGATIEVLTRRQIEAPLRAQGIRTRVSALDRGYPHAHLAFVGDR